MGKRVTCQSIIPGILSYSYWESISEYGSSNNCDTISTSEEFSSSLKELIKNVGLKTVKVLEKSTGEVKEICGSPEIKGVKGTDKRKYLIDLLRINIRDGNY